MRFIYKISYNQDIKLLKHSGYVFCYSLLFAFLMLIPLFTKSFYVGEMAFIFIYSIAGLSLMILLGYTGLPSFGHAGLLAIGAYFNTYCVSHGLPFLLSFILSGLVVGVVGGLIAVPLKHMKGIYFAIATLAFAIVVEEVIARWESVTGGLAGLPVDRPIIFGFNLQDVTYFYYFCLAILIIILYLTLNLLRSPTGRALIAIRDSEISAESMGINVGRFKIISFAISGAFAGWAGALYANKINYISPESFGFILSLQLLMMVVVGGLGSVHGAVFGAIFVGMLPQAIGIAKGFLPHAIGRFPGMEPLIFGVILVIFLIFEPLGLYGRWLKIKLFFDMLPLYRKATFKKQKSYLKTERVQ